MAASTSSPCDITTPTVETESRRLDTRIARHQAERDRWARYRVCRSRYGESPIVIAQWLRYDDARSLRERLDSAEAAEHPEKVGRMTRTSYSLLLHCPTAEKLVRVGTGDVVIYKVVTPPRALSHGCSIFRELWRVGVVARVGAFGIPIRLVDHTGEQDWVHETFWAVRGTEIDVAAAIAGLARAFHERGHWGVEFSNVRGATSFLSPFLRIGERCVAEDPLHTPTGLVDASSSRKAATTPQLDLFG